MRSTSATGTENRSSASYAMGMARYRRRQVRRSCFLTIPDPSPSTRTAISWLPMKTPSRSSFMPRGLWATTSPSASSACRSCPCVAVDRLGDEFVGGLSNGYVAVYAPGAKGNAKTLQRISLPDGHPDVNGVALDAAGDMFVSDSNEVSEFTTPVTNPTLARAIVGTGQQNSPTGMAPNNSSGELYVANAGDNDILGYSATANGKSAPNRTIASRNPSLIAPAGVALAGAILYSTSGSTVDGPPSIFVLDAHKGSQSPRQVVTGSYLALPIGAALGP